MVRKTKSVGVVRVVMVMGGRFAISIPLLVEACWRLPDRSITKLSNFLNWIFVSDSSSQLPKQAAVSKRL